MSTQVQSYLEVGKGKDLKIPAFNVGIERKKTIPEEFQDQVPEGGVYFEGYANKATKDRCKDLILPSFWSDKTLAEYMKNPVLLYMHDRHDVVGKILSAEKKDDGLWVTGFVSGKWPQLWRVEEELIKSLSVWVWVDKAEWDEKADVYKLLEGSLLEISLATIPMNADSVFDISKSMSEDQFNNFQSLFSKSKSLKMDLKSFLKSLIPGLNKFNLGIKEDATPEDIAKAVNDGKSYEDLKKEITDQVTESVTKSVTDSVMKSLGQKVEEDAGKGKSENDKAIADLRKEFEDKLKSVNDSKKSLEDEIALLKGEEGSGKTTNTQPEGSKAKQKVFNHLTSATPDTDSKY